jgi:Flp pilus assembly protein TadD
MAVRNRLLLCAFLAGTGSLPAMAQVDPTAELDELVDATSEPGSGVALARAQIESGELTGAVATLERVLMSFPEASDALLLHASLLCRLDDAAGARAEVAASQGAAMSDRGWSEVTAACGSMPRPTGGRSQR